MTKTEMKERCAPFTPENQKKKMKEIKCAPFTPETARNKRRKLKKKMKRIIKKNLKCKRKLVFDFDEHGILGAKEGTTTSKLVMKSYGADKILFPAGWFHLKFNSCSNFGIQRWRVTRKKNDNSIYDKIILHMKPHNKCVIVLMKFDNVEPNTTAKIQYKIISDNVSVEDEKAFIGEAEYQNL